MNAVETLERIQSFKELKDGWFDGNGEAPSHIVCDMVSRLIEEFGLHDVELPAVFPMHMGGVALEWSGSTRAIDAAFYNDGSVCMSATMNLDKEFAEVVMHDYEYTITDSDLFVNAVRVYKEHT